MSAYERLRDAIAAGDAGRVVDTLADDVVLRVAVHNEPFTGRPAAARILRTVLDGVLREIEVLETITGVEASVLTFRATVDSHPGRTDGLLVAREDSAGRIADLTVFVRPLPALQALADEMGRRLGGAPPTGGGR
ncbi:MAG: nuclear transport factor 2 family protein [Acidimicrobiia bacterium]|nr:nuclear transport factor 2 family protein [Acidimicrobiia bacterium]